MSLRICISKVTALTCRFRPAADVNKHGTRMGAGGKEGERVEGVLRGEGEEGGEEGQRAAAI